MNRERKKMIVYAAILFFCFYSANKLVEGLRLYLEFRDYSGLANLGDGIGMAFESLLPSIHGTDLIAGGCAALIVVLLILQKKEEAKKFRKGIEYGSARWGKPADIEPYIDKDFFNNVLLTKTERLTMNSRPENPKHARNKNVLVIGGSGSGKTRFFVEPNLMQMNASYVVTDPKG